MYLMEKTILDYEAEIIELRQAHLKTCYTYEKQIEKLNEIINEIKHTYYKIPDYEDGESTDFYDEFY